VKHVIRPAAKDDIIRQFRYYLLRDALDVATRFLDAVDEAIEAICRMPHMGASTQFKNPALSGLRFWTVKGFDDILIFYVCSPTHCASSVSCMGDETSRKFSNARRMMRHSTENVLELERWHVLWGRLSTCRRLVIGPPK